MSNSDKKYLKPEFRDPLDIDSENIPENMDYGWIRYDPFFYQFDYEKDQFYRNLNFQKKYCMFQEAIDKGWKAVPLSRHPEFEEFKKDDTEFVKGFVHYNGSLLCERPKEFAEIEREFEISNQSKALQEIPALKQLEFLLGEDGYIIDERRDETNVLMASPPVDY